MVQDGTGEIDRISNGSIGEELIRLEVLPQLLGNIWRVSGHEEKIGRGGRD